MKARFYLSVSAPSADVAMTVVRGALADFNEAHPGVLQPQRDKPPAWTNDNVMVVQVVVESRSQSAAMSLNNEINLLIGRHQKAHGIKVAPLGTLALASGGWARKRWWQIWK